MTMKHTHRSDRADEKSSKRPRGDDPFKALEDLLDRRPTKKQRIDGPPIHRQSFLVKTTLEWKEGTKAKSAEVLLMLDSGATGPVLAQHFIEKHGIPLERKQQRMRMLAANGEHIKGGTHHTGLLSVWMGDHVSGMKFEALEIKDEGPGRLVGYLPMSWLTEQNPDVD